MANYCACVRTNYFRVTDEEKYKKLYKGLSADYEIYDFTKTDPDTKEIYHGFGAYSTIDYYPCGDPFSEDAEDEEPNLDMFLNEIQKIIHPDDAMIIIEVGNEKLRYLVGSATVVTKNGISGTDIEFEAITIAQNLLKNPEYRTSCQF